MDEAAQLQQPGGYGGGEARDLDTTRAESSRPTELEQTLVEQDAALQGLHDALGILQSRLDPILRPPGPDIEKHPNGPPMPSPSTAIGQRVDEHTRRMQHATIAIRDLIQRLEV